MTFLLVVIGWVPFFSDTLGQAGAWLARMFSAGQAGFVDAAALYYLRTAWPVLLIAVFAALPYGCRFGNRFFRAGRTASMVSSLYFIGLLLLVHRGHGERDVCSRSSMRSSDGEAWSTCFIHRKN